MNGASSIRDSFVVTKLLLIESGVYNERFLRSLEVGIIDDNTVDSLTDALTRSGGRFTPGDIGSLSSPVMVLESQIDRERNEINLINGFDKKRFCVIMFVEELRRSNYGSDRKYMITGYTDVMEYSQYSRSIPDNLEFYINAVIETSAGSSVNNLNLFSNNNHAMSSENLLMIRPSDVLARYAFNSADVGGGEGVTRSYRSDRISERSLNTSSRNNGTANLYMGKLLSGLHKTRMESLVRKELDDRTDEGSNSLLRGHLSVGGGRQLESEMEGARMGVRDSSAEEYNFLRLLKEWGRDNSQGVGGFTYRQLRKEVPDIEKIIEISLLDRENATINGRYKNSNDRVGNMDGEKWGGATQEELICTEIANAFTTIASQCAIVSADMVFTLVPDRDYGDYEWDFEIGVSDRDQEGSVLFLDSLDETMEEALIDRLGYLMIDNVLNSYRRYGRDIFVAIQYTMNREMFVSVAIDSDHATEYCSPIYCDSLTSSVLTTSARSGDSIGRKSVALYDQIQRNLRR